MVRCSLCGMYDEDASLHSGVAGLLAGLSYVLHPSLSVFAAALASASEVSHHLTALGAAHSVDLLNIATTIKVVLTTVLKGL